MRKMLNVGFKVVRVELYISRLQSLFISRYRTSVIFTVGDLREDRVRPEAEHHPVSVERFVQRHTYNKNVLLQYFSLHTRVMTISKRAVFVPTQK